MRFEPGSSADAGALLILIINRLAVRLAGGQQVVDDAGQFVGGGGDGFILPYPTFLYVATGPRRFLCLTILPLTDNISLQHIAV